MPREASEMFSRNPGEPREEERSRAYQELTMWFLRILQEALGYKDVVLRDLIKNICKELNETRGVPDFKVLSEKIFRPL